MMSKETTENKYEIENKIISDIYSNFLSCFLQGELDDFYSEIHRAIQNFDVSLLQYGVKENPFVPIIWNQEKQDQSFQLPDEISVSFINNHMNKRYKSCN